MKKIMAVVLAMVWISLMTGGALAASGSLQTTQAFTTKLDREGVTYDPPTTLSSGSELIVLGYTGDQISYNLNLIFYPPTGASDEAQILVTGLTTTAARSETDLLEMCNRFNRGGHFTHLYVEEDGTVTAELDLLLGSGDAGALVYDGVWTLIDDMESAATALGGVSALSAGGLGPAQDGTRQAETDPAAGDRALIGTWTSPDIGSMVGSIAGSMMDLGALGDLISGTFSMTFNADGTVQIAVEASVLGFMGQSMNEDGTWTAENGMLHIVMNGENFGNLDAPYTITGNKLYLKDPSGISVILSR